MKLKISRGFASIETWKDLISALVLVGYEVYAEDEYLWIGLGSDDKIIED